MADVKQEPERVLTVAEACKRLGVCRKTLHNMRKAGLIGAVVRGVQGRIGFLESVVRAVMERRTPSPVAVAAGRSVARQAPVTSSATVAPRTAVASPIDNHLPSALLKRRMDQLMKQQGRV